MDSNISMYGERFSLRTLKMESNKAAGQVHHHHHHHHVFDGCFHRTFKYKVRLWEWRSPGCSQHWCKDKSKNKKNNKKTKKTFLSTSRRAKQDNEHFFEGWMWDPDVWRMSGIREEEWCQTHQQLTLRTRVTYVNKPGKPTVMERCVFVPTCPVYDKQTRWWIPHLLPLRILSSPSGFEIVIWPRENADKAERSVSPWLLTTEAMCPHHQKCPPYVQF